MAGVKVFNETTQQWETIASGDAGGIRTTNPNLKKSDNVDEAITELSQRVDNLKNNVAWIYKNGTIGGGGGTGPNPVATGKLLTSIINNPHYISTTENFSVNYMVESRYTTNFYVTLKLDQQSSINMTIRPNQWYTWEIGRLAKGNHVLFFSGVDVDQMPIDSVTVNVIAGALEITSTFDDRTIFNVASDINIPYTVSSYLTTPINVESSINLTPQPTIIDVPKDRLMNYSMGKRPVGVYNVELQALSSGYTSNKLEYTINVASTDQLFLSVASNIKTTFARGVPIKFAYTIAVLGYTAFITHYEINGKTGQMNSRLGTNVFEIPSDDLSPGTYTLRLTANDADNVISTAVPLEIPITITATDFTPWEPHPSGLVAHFKARGIDASRVDSWPNSINGSAITCALIGINGTSNGFIGSSSTSSIDKSLVINGEAYARINYQPFSDDKQVLTNGMTISILYRTKNIGNKAARVMDCARYNPNTDGLLSGIYIDTEDAEIQTTRTSIGAKIAEDEWINQTFVIDQKFLKIYNNGVITACINHEGFLIDSLTHNGYINLGGRLATRLIGGVSTEVMVDFADCDIKDVKIYSRALTSEQVVYNYVGDEYYLHTVTIDGVLQFDEEKQKALRALNSMNENGEFVIDTTATSPFPIAEIKFTDNDVAAEFREYSERTVWSPNVNKFKQFPCVISYYDYKNNRYLTNHNGFISLQGTSSTGYTSKNYEIYLGKMNDGITDFLYSPRVDWLPENRFTLKCNMMDSSHANNIGTGRLINDNYFRVPIPPKVDTNNNNRLKIKDAVDGFPILLQIAMGRTNENGQEDNYMGVYTFNMGRGSFYNLGLKNADFEEINGVVTALTEKPTGLYAPDKAFAYEISTSNNNGAGAFKQQSNEWINSEFNRIFPANDTTEGFNQLKNVVVKTSNSGPPVVVTDLQGNPILDSQGNPVMTPGGLQFKEQSVWNLPSLADYLILTYMLGMVDNLGKNLLMKTWEKVGPSGAQESVWYTTFYDMDTILGLDNVGIISHGPDVDIDAYPTGNFVVDQNNPENRGRGQYNLSGSRLWELYRENYYRFETAPENEPISFNLLQRYTNLRRSGVLSYDNLVGKYMSVINMIGANYYNRDAEIKYMNQFTNEAGDIGYHNLSFLHGTREHYTKLWLKRRITYLDSIFDASSNLMPGNTSAKGLKFRFNVGNAAIGNRIMDVRSVSPTFITVHWKGEDDIEDYSKLLVKAGTPTRFEKTFSAGTQSTNMNFGPEVMYIENLNVGNPSYLDLSNASRLISLDLSGNTFLQAINLDGCTSLRNLNLRNCTKLGEGASEDPRKYINVSACINLQTLDISNTKLVQVSLPRGGTLKTLRCNNTLITELDLSNQSFLEEVDLSNCTNLTRINLSNCKQLKRIILTNTALSSFLASNCPNLEYVDLSNSSYLTAIDFNATGKMKTLNMSFCNNAALTELNLIGCPLLEDLDMTSCTAKLLRFPNTITTMKRLICRNSSIERTKFGSAAEDTWTTYPAVNLAQLTGLTAIDFFTCKNLRAITNINLTITNGSNTFAYCTNLLRITGNLKLVGSASGMFQFCETFKLYDSQTNANGVVLPADTGNFALNMDVSQLTSASSTFDTCKALDIGHCYYFMRRAINLTSASSTFFNCTGMVTTANRPFPELLFEKANKITNLTSFMHLCGNLGGPLPQKTLWPLTNLTNGYRAFNGCKFTFFDQSTLIENTKLSNAYEMFNGNAFSNSVFGKNLLFKNVALVNTENMFYNMPNFSVILEGDTLFRFNDKLRIATNMFYNCNVTGQLHENTFGGVTPTAVGEENGVSVTYKWPVGIENVGGLFWANQNLTGTLTNNLFKNCTKLQYVNSMIQSTGIAGDIPANLFANNPELISVASFFANTAVTGSIPATLLTNNRKLVSVASLFAQCTELTGSIPSTLFRNNSKLTAISSLFSGAYKLTGTIPGDLFKTLDDNGLEVPLSVTSAANLFHTCYSLSGPIPEDLFKYTPMLTSVANLFYDCGDINRNNQFGMTGPIPEKLFYGLFNLTDTSGAFYRCNKLSATIIEPENPLDPNIINLIPVGLFRDNARLANTSNMFSYMGHSGQIPLGVFDPLINVTNMSRMFYSSMRNQVLDRDLFKYNTKLQNINGMFSNDSATGSASWNQTIPADLFKKYVTSPSISGNPLRDVADAFAKNTALKGNAIQFWTFGTVTSNSNCYYNCTQLTDYASIPTNYK